MLPLQPAASTATSRRHTLIDRVLRLRQQSGINIPLSISDQQNHFFCGQETHGDAVNKEPIATSRSQNWLAWSQSPTNRKPHQKAR